MQGHLFSYDIKLYMWQNDVDCMDGPCGVEARNSEKEYWMEKRKRGKGMTDENRKIIK